MTRLSTFNTLLAAAALGMSAGLMPVFRHHDQPRSSGPKNGKTARRAKQKLAKAAKQKNRGKK